MSVLVISRQQLDDLVEHARAEAPNEACGILAGQGGRVIRVYRGTNIDANPGVRYYLDPVQQLDTFRDVECNGWEVVGIYHSHPESPAYPSGVDLDLAYYPDVAYVIVSLAQGCPEVRAFRIVDGKIDEEQLIVA